MYRNTFAVLLLTILVISPFARVNAEVGKEVNNKDLNSKAQLDSLSLTLISIGTAVSASDSINDTQRLNLMKQLLLISSQITELNKLAKPALNSSVPQIFNNNLLEEAKKDTAKKAGLEQIKVTFDVNKNQAIVETTFKSNSKSSKTTYNFPELNSVIDFDKKIELLRRLVSEKVSGVLKVKLNDVEGILLVTGRNPIKDSIVIANSPTAISLASNFAKNSIVNSVGIYPGKNGGSIIISTDQNESINLVLQREFDYSGNLLSSYTYSYSFYYPTIFDNIKNGLKVEKLAPTPKFSEVSGSLSASEVKAAIVQLFGTVPFSSQVPNFSGKLLSFMTDNDTVYNDFNGNKSQSDCSSPTDKAVVTEYIKYLVSNLDAQYLELSKIIKFHSPVVNDGFSNGCNSISKYF